MAELDHLLQNNELLTSSEFIKRLIAEGHSKDHARNLIRRYSARSGIWRSERLALPKNIRLFSHKSFRGTFEFAEKIIPILEIKRPGIARFFNLLIHRQVLLKPHAELLLATPANPENSRCPSYSNEIGVLEELGLAKRDGTGSALERIVTVAMAGTPQSHVLGIKSRSSWLIHGALTNILLNHFRRQNLISWNSVMSADSPGSLTVFNNFYFSASGFSWLKPLLKVKAETKPKPTPVVFDIWPFPCSVFEIDSFLERLRRAGQNKHSKLNFLGIVAATDFEPAAWNKAREAGLMAINLRQFFGEAALNALVQIEALLKNVAGDPSHADEADFQRFSETLEELKTNPYVVDLRSIGFEAVTALLLRSDGWDDVQMNIKVPFETPNGFSEREVDVNGHKNSYIPSTTCK
jgi:hypothetical protein